MEVKSYDIVNDELLKFAVIITKSKGKGGFVIMKKVLGVIPVNTYYAARKFARENKNL